MVEKNSLEFEYGNTTQRKNTDSIIFVEVEFHFYYLGNGQTPFERRRELGELT